MEPLHLARDGASLGTHGQADVLVGLAEGRFRASDLSWSPGDPAWLPLRERPWAAGFLPRAEPLAWEDPARRWPAAIFPTLRRTLLAPASAFAPVSPADSPRLGPPLAWHLLLATFANLLGLGWAHWLVRPYWEQARLLTGDFLPEWVTVLGYLGVWAVATPLLVLSGAFLATFYLHGFLRLLGIGVAGWRSTFRVLNYVGGSANLILAIPFLGILAGPWGLGCAMAGLASAHGASRPRVGVALTLAAAVVAFAALGVLLLVVLAFTMRLV
jgi:hypothetical protein